MKTQTLLLSLSSVLLPGAGALWLLCWSASVEDAQLVLAAIPCMLLTMSAAFVNALIRSCENRIAELERRLEDNS